MERINTPDGLFSDGTAAAGYLDGTVVIAKWLNDMQEEACAIPLAAGLALDGSKRDQILTGLRRLFGGNVTTINTAGATALSLANSGLVLIDATAGNITLNLPAANVLAAVRYVFRRIDATANTITINRAGADTIDLGATSFSLAEAGDYRHITSDGVSRWVTVSTKAALGNNQGVVSYNANANVPTSAVGKFINCTGSTAFSLVLPLANSVPAGSALPIRGGNLQYVNINRASADNIYVNGTALTTLVVGLGDTAMLVSDGAANWILEAGSAGLPYSTLFGAAKASTGYQKLPSGVIIQWGNGTAGQNGSVFTNTFPLAFPAAVQAIQCVHVGNDASVNVVVDASSFGSLTSFGVRSNYASGNVAMTWIAIGY
ncbi:gp53-like domain-containing protein [Cupriavidus sp. BIC8F]|uniref:gp53-like domain-containing protein n=1 Tax=Cupriavidus sp. BIC8F TaxID=3079014 RepID=UPI0029166DBC|nr:hypothetical protein [Cupriavidus sp. BIC8F]